MSDKQVQQQMEQFAMALKALKTEIKNLKEEVAQLKKDKAELEAENAALKQQINTMSTKKSATQNNTILTALNKNQERTINELTDLINRKTAYITRLEQSLAKYNRTEVMLLKRLE